MSESSATAKDEARLDEFVSQFDWIFDDLESQIDKMLGALPEGIAAEDAVVRLMMRLDPEKPLGKLLTKWHVAQLAVQELMEGDEPPHDAHKGLK